MWVGDGVGSRVGSAGPGAGEAQTPRGVKASRGRALSCALLLLGETGATLQGFGVAPPLGREERPFRPTLGSLSPASAGVQRPEF